MNSSANLLIKLDQIIELYDEVHALTLKMDDIEVADQYPRSVVVPEFPGKYKSEKLKNDVMRAINHEATNAEEIAYERYRNLCYPAKPKKSKAIEYVKQDNEKHETIQRRFGFLYKVSLVGFAIFAVNVLVNYKTLPNVIPVLSAIAAAFAALFFVFLAAVFISKIMVLKKESQKQQSVAQKNEENKKVYAQKLKEYNAAVSSFNAECESFAKEYAGWKAIYLEHLQEEKEIAQKLASNKKSLQDDFYAKNIAHLDKQLKEINDIVPNKYMDHHKLCALKNLITKDGISDMSLAIERYEEHQEEIERLRRQHYQEMRRADEEERRHQEEMSFRKEQERQRKSEFEQHCRDEERRHQEKMHFREEQARQERASRGEMRCGHCIYYSNCRTRRGSGAYNCPGFVPYKK